MFPHLDRHRGVTHLALVLIPALALVVAGPAPGAWIEGGNPISTADGTQAFPMLVADGQGGAIVAWHDLRGGTFDVYAQRISATGDALWANGGVPIATGTGTQKFPVLATDGAGGAIIAWKDDRTGDSDIRAQRISPDGVPLWTLNGVVVCGETGLQQDVELVSDDAGGALLAWRDFRENGVPRIFGQRLDGDGHRLWATAGVALCSAKQQYSVSLAPDGAGGAFLAFFDYRNGSHFDVYAQQVTAAGTLAWSAGGVRASGAAGNQMYPRILADGAGGAYLAWYDARGGSGYDIYAQRIVAGGLLAGGWPTDGRAVCTASGDQLEPVLSLDDDGGLYLAWYDNRSTVSVYAARVAAVGQLVAGWPANGLRVNQSPSTRPAIFANGRGGAVVAWHGTPGATNLDIVATEIDPAGCIAEGWPGDGLYLCTAPGDQSRPQGIELGNGDILLVWSDMRGDAGDIYATRLGANLVNLSVADAGPGFALPVVPRDRGDATPSAVQLSTDLDGNQATTHFNWSIQLEGANVTSGWSYDLSVDGVVVLGGVQDEPAAPGSILALNRGPFTVRGGRHTVRLAVDPAGSFLEADESDNLFEAQFVWSPLRIDAATPRVRTAPPALGDFAEPNSDGFVYAPTAGRAWAVAVAPKPDPLGPEPASDDVDLVVYSDYASPTSGFSVRRGVSAAAGSAIDFVVGGRVVGGAVYPAAVRGAASNGVGQYAIDAIDTGSRLGIEGLEQWPQQVLPADRLVDVYEAELVAGQTYFMTLVRIWGASEMNFSVFGPDPNAVWTPADALARSGHLAENGHAVDVLTFTPAVSGRHPIAVHRSDNTGLDEPVTYHFFWNTTVSGVGDAPAAVPAVVFGGASPNPARSATAFDLALAAPGPVRLVLFDVAGRAVRTIAESEFGAGAHRVTWDGRTDAGAPAAPGIYFARLDAAGTTQVRRLAVVR
jgi:hypothetical protein